MTLTRETGCFIDRKSPKCSRTKHKHDILQLSPSGEMGSSLKVRWICFCCLVRMTSSGTKSFNYRQIALWWTLERRSGTKMFWNGCWTVRWSKSFFQWKWPRPPKMSFEQHLSKKRPLPPWWPAAVKPLLRSPSHPWRLFQVTLCPHGSPSCFRILDIYRYIIVYFIPFPAQQHPQVRRLVINYNSMN